jgi:UDP-N-acetylmuramate--alanine ligase
MAKTKGEPKSLYFIGIKGVAMTGLAVIAKQLGYEVTGSDVEEVFITDSLLAEHGIEYFSGFDANHITQTKPEMVIVSAAYGLQNPEVKAAKSARISTIPQSEMLGKIISRYEGVGVAGVHGKTTTTSMLAFALKEAGFSPSYAIGTSDIPGLEGSSHLGDGSHFIVEADEYKKSDTELQPKFLDYPLQHVIITSIELDHPDVFQSATQVYDAFYKLTTKLPRNGTIVACVDWPLVRRLVGRLVDRGCETYGFLPGASYQVIDYSETDTQSEFWLKTEDHKIGPFHCKMPGKHNALNTAAAFIMAVKLGVSEKIAIKALGKFSGPKRRFELLGTFNGAQIFDDYAHHPSALEYLFEATRARFPGKRLVAVFQPHTYSRTGKLLHEFAKSLQSPDKLILLNIWASAREKSGYVTIKDLIDAVKKSKPDVEYRSSLDEAATFLRSLITPDDVVLLVGAGDVYKIYDKLTSDS